jgi:DNA-binding FrmR family transcriptional regulator
MLSDDEKKRLLHRLSRIGGQVEAVRRMIENDHQCVDVLMQLSAATGALAKVGQIVLENHLQTFIREAMTSDSSPDQDEKIQQLVELFRKYASVIE